jgi:heme-degrading monooxygenase HmoA
VGNRNSDFVVVWEFRVRLEAAAEFEKAYGAEGAWVRLFSGDPAYGGTKLVRDVSELRRYLTFDYWASAETYESFRRNHADAYGVMDRECEGLTESEREIGRFAVRSA